LRQITRDDSQFGVIKIDSAMGAIVLDREAETETVELKLTMNTSSIDFGHEKMNEHAMASDIPDVQSFPNATYSGALVKFMDDRPTAVEGNLALHGVTKPVNLDINRFKCMEHNRTKKEVCGTDATASFNRDDFDITLGKNDGFLMYVNLMISIEADIAD